MAPSESSNADSSADEFAKIGTVLGVHFYLQAAGYLLGQRGCGDMASDSVLAATVLGAQHLSHIFVPFSGVAVPLGPLLCALLLVYAVYFPKLLLRSANSVVETVNQWFIALTIAVCAVAFTVLTLPEIWTTLRTALPWRYAPVIEAIAYLGSLAVLASLSKKFLAARLLCMMKRQASEPIFSRLYAVGIAGMLLLATYVGGLYDGKLDAQRNLCAMNAKVAQAP